MSVRNNTATGGFTITKSDTARISKCYVYVGGTGNVRVLTADGSDITFVGVPAGTTLPISVTQVFSTSTTATSILGLTE